MTPDAICLIGIACLVAGAWLSPPLGLALIGISLVVIGVKKKRSEVTE